MSTKRKYKNFVLWIMGPTASGKTTLAREMLKILSKKERPVIHYDGDEVRGFFGPNLGFKVKDRLLVVKTICYLANKALNSGVNVVVSALTANEDARVYVVKNVKNVILIYLECSLEKCIERDYKGLYKKALSGEIDTLIGINSDYLPFENPDIIIKTENKSIGKNVIELEKRLNEYVDIA